MIDLYRSQHRLAKTQHRLQNQTSLCSATSATEKARTRYEKHGASHLNSNSITFEPTQLRKANTKTSVAGISCSRIGHNAERIMLICKMLQELFQHARKANLQLMIGEKTAIASWATEASRLWDVPLLLVRPDSADTNNSIHPTQSIDLRNPANSKTPRPKHPSAKKRRGGTDLKLINSVDRLYVPYVRKGGRIESAILNRLQSDPKFEVYVVTSPTARLTDAVNNRSMRNGASTKLVACGAREWTPTGTLQQANRSVMPNAVSRESVNQKKDMLPAQLCNEEWLFHCTRAPNGPWPGESEAEFRRSLLLSPELALSREPIDALVRILRQGKLMAQARVSHRDFPVVCFSAKPISNILASRCYRPHVQRWDFEPFGIGIKKVIAESIGIQPVTYLDGSQKVEKNKPDSFRFQSSGSTYDWSQEKEWRSPSCVVLDNIPRGSLCVFAKDSSLAREKLAFSRWPVFFLKLKK